MLDEKGVVTLSALILPVAFLLLFLLFLAYCNEDEETLAADWQHAFVLAAILFGFVLLAIMELLNVFSAISRAGLFSAWLIVSVGLAIYGFRRNLLQIGLQKMWQHLRSLQSRQLLLLSPFLVIFLMLFIVGVISPANNVDSLLYHMPRVVHWAQNQNLSHFATTNYKQLINPIWPELAMLNHRVLVGSDLPVNLVQWFSMFASVIGVTAIAALLGLNRWGIWLTAAFAISIPMGILQSTTTQTDYVAAFWTVCLMYLVVLGKRRELSRLELACLGIALGLGMLSKGTFFAYAPGILVWYFLPRMKTKGFGRTLLQGLMVAAIAVLINTGYWIRNTETFGGPYGGAGFLNNILFFRESTSTVPHLQESVVQHLRLSIEDLKASLPAAANNSRLESSMIGIGFTPLVDLVQSWLVRLIQMVTMNLVTPAHWINEQIFQVLHTLPAIFPGNFTNSLENAAWNHEDTAGNPLHLALLLIALILLNRTRAERTPVGFLSYGTVLAAGFALLALIRTSTIVFSVRYQLPFFILAAPLIGKAFNNPSQPWLGKVIFGGLLLYTIPYLLFNNMRPIIGNKPWPTRTGSILQASKGEILFAIAPHIEIEYEAAVTRIHANHCTRIGLQIDNPPALEYPFWYLLQAPQSGIRIETMNPIFGLERFSDPDFTPCAVLCTICKDQPEIYGLPLAQDYGYLSLYASDE